MSKMHAHWQANLKFVMLLFGWGESKTLLAPGCSVTIRHINNNYNRLSFTQSIMEQVVKGEHSAVPMPGDSVMLGEVLQNWELRAY